MLDEIDIENQGYKAGWNAALEALIGCVYGDRIMFDPYNEHDMPYIAVIETAENLKKK